MAVMRKSCTTHCTLRAFQGRLAARIRFALPVTVTVPGRSDLVIVHQARDRQLYHLRHTRDYEALGIPIGASKADAKAAYRQLAKARQLDPNQSPNMLTLAKIPMHRMWQARERLLPSMQMPMCLRCIPGQFRQRGHAAGRSACLPSARQECCRAVPKFLVLGWLSFTCGLNVHAKASKLLVAPTRKLVMLGMVPFE